MVMLDFIFSQLYLFPSVVNVVNVNGQAGKAGLGSVHLSRWPSDHLKKKKHSLTIAAPTERMASMRRQQCSSKGQLASMRRPRSQWAVVVASEGMRGTPD